MKNYYKILSVSLNADDAEIEQAYRRLASIFFPDGNSVKGAEDKFIEISEAYETLINKNSRTSYDWALKVYHSSLHTNKKASRQFGFGGYDTPQQINPNENVGYDDIPYSAGVAGTFEGSEIVENASPYEEVPLIEVFVWLFLAGCLNVVFVLILKLLTLFR